MSDFAGLQFGENVPEWTKPLARWCFDTINPEWTVRIEAVECPDPQNPLIVATAESIPHYLDCVITVGRDMDGSADNQLRLIHEFCHSLFSTMKWSAGDLEEHAHLDRDYPANDPGAGSKCPVWINFCRAEETAAVRLSRVLWRLWQLEGEDK